MSKKKNKIIEVIKGVAVGVGVLAIAIAGCSLLMPKETKEDIKTQLTAEYKINDSVLFAGGNYAGSVVNNNRGLDIPVGTTDIVVKGRFNGEFFTSTTVVDLSNDLTDGTSCYGVTVREGLELFIYSDYNGVKDENGSSFVYVSSFDKIESFAITEILVNDVNILEEPLDDIKITASTTTE